MKIRRNSITWGETGIIKALARADMSPGPKIRVLLATLVSALLAFALLTYVKSDELFIHVILVVFCALGPMAIWADLYAGRGIELTRNRITMFSFGSRMPRSIMFSDVIRCETRTISARNCEISVLVVETSDGKTATIELPQGSDTEVVATFLREKKVLVDPDA